jgi:hypothetical protein
MYSAKIWWFTDNVNHRTFLFAENSIYVFYPMILH